jgi:capsular exopolysaccharide synthesis family protein
MPHRRPEINPVPAQQLALPAPAQGGQLEMALPPGFGGEGDLQIAHYLWLLRTNFIKIAAFVALSMIVTAIATSRQKRIYEATATLYIDRGAAKNLVGQESQSTVAGRADSDSFVNSQLRILQSDSVVRPTAEKLSLLEKEGQIHPKTDPPERINRVLQAPIQLKGMRITHAPNTYIMQIAYRSPDRNLAADVANGIASSYIEHTYDIRIRSSQGLSSFMQRQLDELRANMESSGARLAALERELNMINPEEKTNITSSRLLQLNSEYTKAESDAERAQSSYNALSKGSLDAALISSQGGTQLGDVMKRLNEAREHFADVKSKYGARHPEYARQEALVKELENQLDGGVQLLMKQAGDELQRARDHQALLKNDVDETKAEYDRLNMRSFEYQRAKQEADADKKLYDELVRKIREDAINAGFRNDVVQLADPARPPNKAVAPVLAYNLAIAFAISTLLAVAGVVVADRMDTTIRNPDQVAQTMNVRVVGVLPGMRKGRLGSLMAPAVALIPRGAEDGNTPAAERGLALTGFDEAVRTIRNSILLTDFDRRLRTILLTSAAPSEGKSTVAAHLAMTHAEQGHKTLLIDGDMRRPSAHRFFDLSNTTGLSRVMAGDAEWHDVIVKPREDVELYVMTAGPPTRRAPDLIGPGLPVLLDQAREEFDLVVLDAPPLLGFPEPLQMAVSSDGVLIVTRAGQTDRKAVSVVLNTLNELRANVIGIVLNEVRKDMSSNYSYYGYGYYGKYYGKYYADRKDGEKHRV